MAMAKKDSKSLEIVQLVLMKRELIVMESDLKMRLLIQSMLLIAKLKSTSKVLQSIKNKSNYNQIFTSLRMYWAQTFRTTLRPLSIQLVS